MILRETYQVDSLEHAMAAGPSIDPVQVLHEQLAAASPDLLRSLLSTFIDALMSAEADAVCGAPYGMSSPERVNVRNGYRHRDFDTRAGTLDVAIPKLRSGSYFPDWLLERRRRAYVTTSFATAAVTTLAGSATVAGHTDGSSGTSPAISVSAAAIAGWTGRKALSSRA